MRLTTVYTVRTACIGVGETVVRSEPSACASRMGARCLSHEMVSNQVLAYHSEYVVHVEH